MKVFESRPSKTAITRLVLAGVVVGIIVMVASRAAPPVTHSIATGNLSSAEVPTFLYGDTEVLPETGVDVQKTEALPVEPLSMSY